MKQNTAGTSKKYFYLKGPTPPPLSSCIYGRIIVILIFIVHSPFLAFLQFSKKSFFFVYSFLSWILPEDNCLYFFKNTDFYCLFFLITQPISYSENFRKNAFLYAPLLLYTHNQNLPLDYLLSNPLQRLTQAQPLKITPIK